MKNILVKSLFEVRDSNWFFRDRSDELDLHSHYVEMHQLSTGSFKRHLKGEWEFKFVSGTVDQINHAFIKTFHDIYELWRQGNTNILYTDPDTVAMQDIDPWQISDQFMMFNHTDPKSFSTPNKYNRQFDHFFNAGVRYFPATMSQRTWDIGLEMAKDWDTSTYDTEQIILNSMLWDQGITLQDALRPQWAYQAQGLPDRFPLWYQDLWNGISINQASIIHVHGSRGADRKLEFMKQLANH
jgi:hypothetical protein